MTSTRLFVISDIALATCEYNWYVGGWFPVFTDVSLVFLGSACTGAGGGAVDTSAVLMLTASTGAGGGAMDVVTPTAVDGG